MSSCIPLDMNRRCNFCLKGLTMVGYYQCLVCFHYKLCCKCFLERRYNNMHYHLHPCQLVQYSFPWEHTFTCPYCGTRGFDIIGLCHHALNCNQRRVDYVNCPVCLANPSVSCYLVNDLADHLYNFHRRNILNSGNS